MPSVVLKRLVMTGLESKQMDKEMIDATDFILERLESLGHSELASRLTLTCIPAHVEPQNVNDLPVTIIDVFDECALTQVGYFVSSIRKLFLSSGSERGNVQVLPNSQAGPPQVGGKLPLPIKK